MGPRPAHHGGVVGVAAAAPPRFPRRLVLAVVAVTVVALAGLAARRRLHRVRVRAAGRATVRLRACGGHRTPSPPGPAAAAQSAAVAWITSQVSGTAVIGCYPAMCASLERAESARAGGGAGPGMTGVLKTDVVATLPAAGEAGRTLADQYAPALIASFGAGGSRIEVRAVARTGAAAYQSALRSDLAARKRRGCSAAQEPAPEVFTAADAARNCGRGKWILACSRRSRRCRRSSRSG